MGLAETARNAREGLQVWEDTYLADLRAELAREAARVASGAAVPPPYPAPRQEDAAKGEG